MYKLCRRNQLAKGRLYIPVCASMLMANTTIDRGRAMQTFFPSFIDI